MAREIYYPLALQGVSSKILSSPEITQDLRACIRAKELQFVRAGIAGRGPKESIKEALYQLTPIIQALGIQLPTSEELTGRSVENRLSPNQAVAFMKDALISLACLRDGEIPLSGGESTPISHHQP